MTVNSLPKTVTRHRRGCDLNPGSSAPESSTLITRLPSHPLRAYKSDVNVLVLNRQVDCNLHKFIPIARGILNPLDNGHY